MRTPRRAAVAVALGMLALGTVLAAQQVVEGWTGAPDPSVVTEHGLDRSLSPGSQAVDRLDPAVRNALWRVAVAAQAEGHEVRLNSGWRTPEHQRRLYREALARHGTARVAERYVASPERSTHVTGLAVDLGPPSAAAWVDQNGARYGLCRTFANEGWHFELVADSSGRCPNLLPDASARR